jgi:DNA-directed RNA polymerase III subunit RPC6
MASRLGATINKILDLCRAHSQGLPQKVLDEELQEVEVEIIKQSLNFLLQKQKLQVFMQGESIVYREQDTEAAAKFKGLTSEDMLVYQAI